jgi:hypothetical protein
VLVATCRSLDRGTGSERLVMQVVDDRGHRRQLGWAPATSYAYFVPSACQKVTQRVDATGRWVVSVETPGRKQHRKSPDYHLTDVVVSDLRRHVQVTVYRSHTTDRIRRLRMLPGSRIAVFDDGGVTRAISVPDGSPVTVPPRSPPRGPATGARCHYPSPGMTLADGRTFPWPGRDECGAILGWLNSTEIAIAIMDDPWDPDLQTLAAFDVTTGSHRTIPADPRYDPLLDEDIVNVDLVDGAASGGKVFFDVRRIKGKFEDIVQHDVWAVDSRGKSRHVARFRGRGDAATGFPEIAPWPL